MARRHDIVVIATALAGLLYLPAPSFAIDCSRANSAVEKAICDDPKLKAADAALGATYFNLLKLLKGTEAHDLLIFSQKRWLKKRDRMINGDEGEDIKPLLLRVIMARQDFLVGGDKSFAERIEERKAMAARYTGGPFAGHEIDCFFTPQGFGDGAYVCLGTKVFQNGNKICRLSQEWASGHITDYRTVAKIEGDAVKTVATCSQGYAASDERCPDLTDTAEEKKTNRWNLRPVTTRSTPVFKRYPDQPSRVSIDPDDMVSLSEEHWLHACLTDTDYPRSTTEPRGQK